jgi:TonB family protein
VQNCLSRFRASLPGSAGAVKVQWTVQMSGDVTDVQVVDGVAPGSELGKCLVKAVKSFDFPRHTGPGARTMKLPFTYSEK